MNPLPDNMDQIEAKAAEWLARRDRGFSAEETRTFLEWCREDPRHQAAVDDLQAVWTALDGLSALASQQLRADGAPVAPSAHPSDVGGKPIPSRPPIVRWWPAFAAAAAIAIMAGISFWRFSAPKPDAAAEYLTAVGDQRQVVLPDGSEVQLNTDTSISVRMSKTERRVTLAKGEAFFHVVPDGARPFIVAAANSQTRVVGTRFVVRLRETATELLVAEGKVKFGPGNPASVVNVSSNQSAVLAAAGDAVPRVTTLDPETVARRMAWQSGRLDFKATPLREVVAEFNRYHKRQLVLRDEATGDVPVGGPFLIRNLDGFVRLLDKSFEVGVVRQDGDQIVLALRR